MQEREPTPSDEGGSGEVESSPEAPQQSPSFLAGISDLMQAAEEKEPTPEDKAKPILEQVQGDYASLTKGEPTNSVLITPIDRLKDPEKKFVLQEMGVNPEKDHPFGGDLMPDSRLSSPEARDCSIFSIRTPDNKHTGILLFTRPDGRDAIIATDPRKLEVRTFQGGNELLRSTAGYLGKAVIDTIRNPEKREHKITG